MRYTWDEMVEVDCLFRALEEGVRILYAPDLLADQLEAYLARCVKQEKRAACAAGLAKLRAESRDKLAALCAGKTDWLYVTARDDATFELILKEAGRTPPARKKGGKG
jgi:hypothetical protein